LWFDRPILDEPFIGLPGRTMQWAFDKRLVFASGDRHEPHPVGHSHDASNASGGGTGAGADHLSLVSSGAASVVSRTNEELIRTAHDELLDALPAARAAKLVRGTVVREPRATFSLAPGQPARPRAETAVRGLVLAGDWIDTGLPATIESAVRSGHRAADLCR
jgi:hypothetical protein